MVTICTRLRSAALTLCKIPMASHALILGPSICAKLGGLPASARACSTPCAQRALARQNRKYKLALLCSNWRRERSNDGKESCLNRKNGAQSRKFEPKTQKRAQNSALLSFVYWGSNNSIDMKVIIRMLDFTLRRHRAVQTKLVHTWLHASSLCNGGYASLRRNVDLTSELVALMTAQRNYQANAKTISTSDKLTQALFNAV